MIIGEFATIINVRLGTSIGPRLVYYMLALAIDPTKTIIKKVIDYRKKINKCLLD